MFPECGRGSGKEIMKWSEISGDVEFSEHFINAYAAYLAQ